MEVPDPHWSPPIKQTSPQMNTRNPEMRNHFVYQDSNLIRGARLEPFDRVRRAVGRQAVRFVPIAI